MPLLSTTNTGIDQVDLHSLWCTVINHSRTQVQASDILPHDRSCLRYTEASNQAVQHNSNSKQPSESSFVEAIIQSMSISYHATSMSTQWRPLLVIKTITWMIEPKTQSNNYFTTHFCFHQMVCSGTLQSAIGYLQGNHSCLLNEAGCNRTGSK